MINYQLNQSQLNPKSGDFLAEMEAEDARAKLTQTQDAFKTLSYLDDSCVDGDGYEKGKLSYREDSFCKSVEELRGKAGLSLKVNIGDEGEFFKVEEAELTFSGKTLEESETVEGHMKGKVYESDNKLKGRGLEKNWYYRKKGNKEAYTLKNSEGSKEVMLLKDKTYVEYRLES